MKTLTTKFLATTLTIALVSIFNISVNAAGMHEPASIKKISASGNVRVYITLGTEEKIEVATAYNENKSMIKAEDGTLKIASYASDELSVLVTVTYLESIEADGDAFIQSLTDLGIASEDIYLDDDAVALLKSEKGEVFLTNED